MYKVISLAPVTLKIASLVFVLAGCFTEVVQPDDVLTPGDLAGIAESYCKQHPDWPCGHVYECLGTPADNPLGFVETCVLDASTAHPGLLDGAESMYGMCQPTPRHEGLCWWCCGGTCGPGCNAYTGCYCPPPTPPAPDPIPTDPFPVPPTMYPL